MASQNTVHYGRVCESSFDMRRRARSNQELCSKRQATGSILSTLMLVCSINKGLIRQAVRLPLQGSIQEYLYTWIWIYVYILRLTYVLCALHLHCTQPVAGNPIWANANKVRACTAAHRREHMLIWESWEGRLLQFSGYWGMFSSCRNDNSLSQKAKGFTVQTKGKQ